MNILHFALIAVPIVIAGMAIVAETIERARHRYDEQPS